MLLLAFGPVGKGAYWPGRQIELAVSLVMAIWALFHRWRGAQG
jgi:hypothetical protein